MNSSLGSTEVRGLARVLLQMRTFHTDTYVARQHQPTIDVQRLVVLTDLICLREVGIEVVLSVEGARLHSTVECKPESHRQLHRMAVEYGERTGKTECDGIDVGVGLITEAVGAGTEEFGLRRKFHVYFETNHQFPAVDELLGGCNHTRRIRNGTLCGAHAARSSSAATRNIGASPKAGASTCTPTGKPASPVPNGTLMAA